MWMTPERPPIRCSMDWTQDPQVMPSTPRITLFRSVFIMPVGEHHRNVYIVRELGLCLNYPYYRVLLYWLTDIL